MTFQHKTCWSKEETLLIKEVFSTGQGRSEELYTAMKDHDNYDACAFTITIRYNIESPVEERQA